jgi:hypothetical protein
VEGKSAKIILYQGFNPTVRIKPRSWACDTVLTLKINELVLLKSEGNPKSLDNEKKRPLDEPGSRVNLSIRKALLKISTGPWNQPQTTQAVKRMY